MANLKAGVLEGPKISNKHHTTTEDAQIVIKAAKKDPRISKIVLGEVINLSGGQRRLKFQMIPAGFKVTVRGIGSQQILYLYTREPLIRQKIEEYFNRY